MGEAIVTDGVNLKVKENALLPLQRLLSRAKIWQHSTLSAISLPPPEEFNMHLIKELRTQKEHIPVRISLERRLTAMIEDDGARYCLCKGPSDGSFMIGCDFCDEWYHGRCIGVSAAVGDALANAGDQFMCPKCASKSGVEYKFGLTSVASISDEEDEDCDEDDKQDDIQSKKEW